MTALVLMHTYQIRNMSDLVWYAFSLPKKSSIFLRWKSLRLANENSYLSNSVFTSLVITLMLRPLNASVNLTFAFIIFKFWLIIRWVGGSRTKPNKSVPHKSAQSTASATQNIILATHSDINPVCLHALGFLLLASSIPRTIVHCLLPTIHHNDVFLTAAYFVTLFASACNLKGR